EDSLTLSVKDDQVSVLRGARTTTTEQCAFIATASDTLPSRNLLKPRRPCEPTTISSAAHFFASCKIACFVLPESTAPVAFKPAEASTCSALLTASCASLSSLTLDDLMVHG